MTYDVLLHVMCLYVLSFINFSINFPKIKPGMFRNLLEIMIPLSCSYRITVKHEGVYSIYFFNTLHMFVKELPNKLWKIHNLSVILDKSIL